MKRALLALLVVIFGVYSGPKNGEKRDSNFSFSHSSDWQNTQISNVVQNDHTNGLVVDWPKGGITRGERNPIPPGSSDLNRYACPETSLTADDTAQLFYGLSHTPKTAGVYACGQQKAAFVELRSQIILSVASEKPYQIQVSSTVDEGRAVNVFTLSREAEIALALTERVAKEFGGQDWKLTPKAFATISGAELLLSHGLSDASGAAFIDYYLLRAPSLKATVRLSGASFVRTTKLVVVVDQRRTYISSGFVSMYLPATQG